MGVDLPAPLPRNDSRRSSRGRRLQGGSGVLVGPTGGYLAGFPLAAFSMSILRGWYLRRISKRFAELGARDWRCSGSSQH
uniref:Uncharacterized protein n=1 Tax=Thermofilum pendens TaxID=2269 RepID=A0A7C3WUA7_THEPE